MKPLIAYYNGVIGAPDNIAIPLSDRSIFFGDAVYDAALVKNGKIFLVNEHIERLLSGAKTLKIKHNFTAETLKRELLKIASAYRDGVYFLYFQLSRSCSERVHSYRLASSASLLITLSEVPIPDPSRTLSLVSIQDTRYRLCNIKTVNLLPAVLAAGYADEKSADEAVFVKNGRVTECSRSNISILSGGRLYTHPLNEHILPGITRKHLLYHCERLGIKVHESAFSLSDLREADEVLVSSTTKLCVRAVSLDGMAIGGKDTRLSEKICTAVFDEFVHYD